MMKSEETLQEIMAPPVQADKRALMPPADEPPGMGQRLLEWLADPDVLTGPEAALYRSGHRLAAKRKALALPRHP